ncbi:uncharacterized protein METZ01_LOCUS8077 [marine metagenome]|uniref:Uncharacterized protein n=1 Tax=marine metagenome TaxID=408172 RepID=A0A381NNW5_9ZZZZ
MRLSRLSRPGLDESGLLGPDLSWSGLDSFFSSLLNGSFISIL